MTISCFGEYYSSQVTPHLGRMLFNIVWLRWNISDVFMCWVVDKSRICVFLCFFYDACVMLTKSCTAHITFRMHNLQVHEVRNVRCWYDFYCHAFNVRIFLRNQQNIMSRNFFAGIGALKTIINHLTMNVPVEFQ